MRHALVVILLFVLGSAQGAPVTWYLTDFAFDDGGTASGSFVMDSANWLISDVNIVTTDGTSFTGGAYTAENVGFVPGIAFQFFTDYLPGQTNEYALVLWDSGIDTSGGTFQLHAGEFLCINELSCGINYVELRTTVIDGTLTSVPIPAAVWLFGSGLGLLGWVRRRQTA